METLTRVSDARFEWCLNVNVEANEARSKKKEKIRLKYGCGTFHDVPFGASVYKYRRKLARNRRNRSNILSR